MVLTFVALVASGSLAWADAGQDRGQIESLRKQGLFREAANYCRGRLARQGTTTDDRAQLTVELVRTLREHAVQLRPAERDRLWEECQAATERFVTDHPRHAKTIDVQLQGATALVACGELERQEAELASPDAPLDRPRDTLRRAITSLKRLRDEVTARRIKSNQDRGARANATLAALAPIEVAVEYQLARALRNQGLSFPAGSADRINALQQAVELLASLGQLPEDPLIAWMSRVDAVTCYRLLGQFDRAEAQLQDLAADKNPKEVQARIAAEKLRLSLAQGRIDGAIFTAEVYTAADTDEPELALAYLETCLATWHRSNERREKADAKAWEKKATDVVNRMEKQFSPYWSRRAENLLAARIDDSPGAENPDVLARAGDSLYRRGNIDQALAAYDRAAAQAASRGDKQKTIELAFKAATVEHERKRYDKAAERYRRLSLKYPSEPKAADAHLIAIVDAGQSVTMSDAAALEAYAELLEEHLSHWPQSKTAAEAAWRLGAVREHQKSWAGALAAYRTIPSDHAKSALAVDAVARCFRRSIVAGKTNAARQKLAKEAVDYFEALVVADDGKLPVRWSAAQQAAVLAAAQFWLEFMPDGYAQAEAVLRAALEHNATAPQQWKQSARMLLVWALAGQGQLDKARAAARELSPDNPKDLITLVEKLEGLAHRMPMDGKKAMANLQLELIGLLEAKQPSFEAAEAAKLQRMRAMALAQIGRRSEALAVLDRLAGAGGDDIQVHEALATLLSLETGSKAAEQALIHWNEVEQKSRPGSARWFRARLGRAQTQLALGRKSQAHKLVKSAEVSYPDLGGPTLREKFRAVSAACEKK